MTSTPAASVAAAIARLGRRYVELARARTGALPVAAADPDWPSPCEMGPAADGHCYWRPIPMQSPPAFSRLTDALEQPIHADLVQFYGTAWSAPLPVCFEDNQLELLQLWSTADFENLLSNLIGHALEKKRVRQPLSFFFALVDDQRFLSIDNASGQVCLETLGQRAPLVVAETLSGFLQRVVVAPLTPGDA